MNDTPTPDARPALDWLPLEVPDVWRPILEAFPAPLGADVSRPDGWAVARCPDGLWLRAVVWGDGGLRPYQVRVYTLNDWPTESPDVEDWPSRWPAAARVDRRRRWPTLPELTSVLGCADLILPTIAAVLPPLAGPLQEPGEGGPVIPVDMAQAGVVPGTPAETRFKLANTSRIPLTPPRA